MKRQLSEQDPVNRTLKMSSRKKSAPSIWLDAFPPEIIERIAYLLSFRKTTTAALHLAESSAQQAKAVTSVCRYKCSLFYIEPWRSDLISDDSDEECDCDLEGGVDDGHHRCDQPRASNLHRRWAQVFQDRIVDLTAAHFDPSANWNIVKSRTLKRLNTDDGPAHLAQIALATSIDDLHIDLHGGRLSLDCLEAIQLKRLSLLCAARDTVTCSLAKIAAEFQRNTRLRSLLQKLPSLDLDCGCFYSSKSDLPFLNPIWTCVPKLEALQHLGVSVTVYPPENINPFLCQLQSVVARKGDFGSRLLVPTLAEDLGHAVTVFEDGVFAEEYDMFTVTDCSRLRSIESTIYPETSSSFSKAMALMPNLHSLDLTWGPYYQFPIRNCPLFPNRFYQEIDETPDMLSQYLKTAKGLEEFGACDLRISKEEIVRVLQILGNRLRVFRTSIAHQDQKPLDRLIMVMETLIQANPSLTKFDISEYECQDPIRMSMETIRTLLPKKRRTLGLVKKLEKSAREFDATHIHEFLYGLKFRDKDTGKVFE